MPAFDFEDAVGITRHQILAGGKHLSVQLEWKRYFHFNRCRSRGSTKAHKQRRNDHRTPLD